MVQNLDGTVKPASQLKGATALRVVIVGAGVGGLTAALLLRATGARVTVLEQADALTEAGAGLQISPNASRILIGLGLEPALRAVACEPGKIELADGVSGRPMLQASLAGAEARWGAPYLHLHRADLQRILVDALAGVELRLDARVAAVDAEAGTVRLEGGETVPGDVVIGADGLRSAVRTALLGADAPRFTGQTAWRGLVPADKAPAALRTPAARAWLGPGRHFVSYPVRGGALVNFVGIVERDWRLESWREAGDPADLARDFAGWTPPIRALIANVETAWTWALFDRAPLPRWSKGRATLLGDAAHPMLPFLAQGAAMAIEDATALARHLASGPSVEAALRGYEAERLPRATRVQAASRRNATLFHLPGPAARTAFGLAGLKDRLDPSGGLQRFDWLYGYGYDRAEHPGTRTTHG
jgi:salicylate hydroxylase